MLHHFPKTIATVALSLAAVNAYAQEASANITGNQLLEICKSDDMATQGFCVGYSVGVVEGMRWGAAVPMLQADVSWQDVETSLSTMLRFCLPEGATYGQYHDVIVRYIDQHPETRYGSARLLAQQALIEAFPCDGP